MKTKIPSLSVLIISMILASCTPGLSQTTAQVLPTLTVNEQPTVGIPLVTPVAELIETPTINPTQLGNSQVIPEAVSISVKALAARLNIAETDILIVNVEEVQWPDGCLGAGRPDEMCTQAIVDGYRIILEAGAQQYEFHTDSLGKQMREVQAEGPKGDIVTSIPVKNARLFLAQKLGVDIKEVKLTSVTAVDWPNSCLGVEKKDQVCTQVITPGYRITFEAVGIAYEIHTDQAGGTVVLALNTGIQLEGAAFEWEETNATTCRKIEIDGTELQYGLCQETLSKVTFSPVRMEEWRDLVTSNASFESNTLSGKVQFTGQGKHETGESEQQSFAEWARLLYSEVDSGRFDPAAGALLIWHREGGIAGFCNDIIIYSSGWAYASSCGNSNPAEQTRVRLTADQMDLVYDWSNQLMSFEAIEKDEATADSMEVKITFSGSGQQAQTPDIEQEMMMLAENLYLQASK